MRMKKPQSSGAAPGGVDLTNCDREPIHIPGSIQPHGALLVCTQPEWTVAHASANAKRVLGHRAEDVLGRPLTAFIASDAVHSLRNLLQQASLSAAPERLFGLALGPGLPTVDAAVHMAGDRVMIELEPVHPGRVEGDDPITLVKSLMGRLRKPQSLEALCQSAARQMRALTGFDRVMVYRFAHDGSGEVIAEVKRPDLEPFLGLHYPATDIPKQARELYKRNWIRLIGDIGYEPVAIVPELDTRGHPVDLSLVGLRSVSPIHVQYLENMGVDASMSISIMSDDDLWGLIACHHYAPRHIAPALRSVVELYGHMFSMQVNAREREESFDYERRARIVHDRLIGSMAPEDSLWDNLDRYRDLLRSLIPSDGIGVWIDGEFIRDGHTPGRKAVEALVAFLGTTPDVCAIHDLPHRVPEIGQDGNGIAGVLAIPISRSPRDYLMFFRREVVRTITWAGQPDKQVTVAANANELSPRRSFAAWREVMRDQSMPWLPSEHRAAEALRISLLEVILRRVDLVERERRSAQKRQELLIAELNHRVKNILALMRAIVSRSESAAQDARDLARSLDGRIGAFAVAHDQLVRSQHRTASLRYLVETELAPYREVEGDSAAVKLEGADIAVDAEAYTTLALVLHELTTNAAKYGALSAAGGTVSVTWRVEDSGDLALSWSEAGGPPVAQPNRRGFGSTIIERSVPHELGGEAEVVHAPLGLQATFRIPARYISTAVAAPDKAGARKPSAMSGLAGLHVLLVEDNLVIALDAEEALRALGAAEVRTASTVSAGLETIERERIDAAIVDLHLGRETAVKITEALKRRNIPFALATGYGADAENLPDLATVPVLAKPYTRQSLGATVEALMATKPGEASPDD